MDWLITSIIIGYIHFTPGFHPFLYKAIKRRRCEMSPSIIYITMRFPGPLNRDGRTGASHRAGVRISRCLRSVLCCCLWTPKPWKTKVLHPENMGYNPQKWRLWVLMVICGSNISLSIEQNMWLFRVGDDKLPGLRWEGIIVNNFQIPEFNNQDSMEIKRVFFMAQLTIDFWSIISS